MISGGAGFVKLDIPTIFHHSKFHFGKSGLLHVHVDDGGAVQQLARHAGVGAGRVDHDGRARRYVRRRLYRTCRPIAVGIDGLVRVMVMVMVRVRVRVRVRVGVRARG